ncbi:MAG: sigma-54-dependent Fis family transcriptional regulator [Deltaproteobacteria bacterium]|nr:sigma-54-dependent Fis family transcriptional regulator [Deltaproteobacteria bacterium]
MGNIKVLLAEKDLSELSALRDIFVKYGYETNIAVDGVTALEKITSEHYDLIISVLELPKISGIDLLQRVKEINRSTPIILTSANARVNEAVSAMKLGAYDFILKPLTFEMIEIIISKISNDAGINEASGNGNRFSIITNNSEMKNLMLDAKRIADSMASVFIHGASGTGKELFARYIHNNSKRKDKPFVAVNCSALPESLLESELFGHEKGSFTGAITRKKGKFEIADHGTILLDEISEMDISLQSKLLRVIQEREIDRVGGTAPIPMDVRIIATTNRDIKKQINEGKFREDLFYRLNVIPLHLPLLSERKDDIPLLANYFIEKYNKLDNRAVKGLTPEIIDFLMEMSWKGNVRELENAIERAVLMGRGDFIDDKSLFTNERRVGAGKPSNTIISTVPLKEMEKTAIFYALNQTNGNRTHAADLLGISVRTLRNKLNEYRKRMEGD